MLIIVQSSKTLTTLSRHMLGKISNNPLQIRQQVPPNYRPPLSLLRIVLHPHSSHRHAPVSALGISSHRQSAHIDRMRNTERHIPPIYEGTNLGDAIHQPLQSHIKVTSRIIPDGQVRSILFVMEEIVPSHLRRGVEYLSPLSAMLRPPSPRML